MLSAVTSLPIEVHWAQTTAVGAAACATVATGTYSGLGEAAAQMAIPAARIQPNKMAAPAYEPYYQSWVAAFHTLHNTR